MKLPVVIVGVGVATAVAVVGIAWASGALDKDEPAVTPVVTTTDTPSVLPEGVYRYRLTKQDVRAVNAALTPDQVAEAVGTYTWTIRDGKISFRQTDCQCSLDRLVGRYNADENVLVVQWPEKAPNGEAFCGENCIDTLGWSFDGAALQLTPVEPSREAILFWGGRKPWVKIG